MAKVSFDYDGTLGESHKIRCFAKVLVRNLHEVWIVTARYENIDDYDKEFMKKYNISKISEAQQELFRHALWCGIPTEQIKFCNMQPKARFFEKENFLWHLDDDAEEIDQINVDTTTIAISCVKGGNWVQTCRDLIKNTEDDAMQKLPF